LGETAKLRYVTLLTHVFAIGAFWLHVASLVEMAFERHLGIGRNPDVVGQALYDRGRLATHLRYQRQFVVSLAHRRGDEVERMSADRERDRKLLAAPDAVRIDAF